MSTAQAQSPAAGAGPGAGVARLNTGIEIVVGDSKGSVPDVLARMLLPGLQERLGVTVSVKNIPHENVATVLNYVKGQDRRQDKRLHTFVVGNPLFLGVPQAYSERLPHEQELAPVSHLVDYPFGILVNRQVIIYEGAESHVTLVLEGQEEADDNAEVSSPMQTNGINSVLAVKRLEQFMAWLRTEDAAEIGVSEARPLSSVLASQLANLSNTKTRLVKFSNSSHLAQGLRDRKVHAAIGILPALAPLLNVDGINLLAVTSKRRLRALPDVPTLYENGLGIGGVSWDVLFAPKTTPPAVQQAVSEAVQDLFQDREFKKKLRARFFNPVGSNAETAAEMMDRYRAHWSSVLRKSTYLPPPSGSTDIFTSRDR